MPAPIEVELVGGPMDGTVLHIEEPEAPLLRFPIIRHPREGDPPEVRGQHYVEHRVYEYWACRARSRGGRPTFRWGGEADA